MSEVLVIGHRNPDTDSITSAIGYAEFKRRTGLPSAVAARCGDTNDRIDFVLKTFGVPAPRFIADVSPKIRDVMQPNVASVTPSTTVAEALGLMDEQIIRVLPVLNDDNTCKGLVSVFKMTKFFYPAPDRPVDSRRILATLHNLASTLKAEKLFAVNEQREEELILMIAGMSLQSFAERLNNYPPKKMVVLVGDRVEIQRLAIDQGVRVVVITGGFQAEPAVLNAAKRNKVSLLLTPFDTATTAMFCRAAITVEHMIHEEFLSFREEDHLSQVRHLATTSNLQAFPVLDPHGKMVGILSKTDFLKKVERQLILVDHNELSQAVHGADEMEILEVIDHHRIGSLTTHHPILFRNEPVGSTSTIVADCYFRYQVEMTKPIAGLLLAGLVSDTLNLTSPTTTSRDKEILEQLEKISGVNARKFTEKLFASGSVLTSKSAAKAITADCKEYHEAGKAFSVAQIEEIGFEPFCKRVPEVRAALESYRSSKGYYFSALLVTDVTSQRSLLMLSGAEKMMELIDYPLVEPGLFEMENVVSRKKQVLPYLTHCLQSVK